MDNGLAVSDFENSLIVQAHEFFQEQLKKWLEDSVAPRSTALTPGDCCNDIAPNGRDRPQCRR